MRSQSREKSQENGDEPDYAKDEAKRIFIGLLKDKAITSGQKWEQAFKSIVSDPRHQVIKTISEKKKIFNDYLFDLRKVERTENRQKAEMNKDLFKKMLEDAKNLTSDSKFMIAKAQFYQDARWKAVGEKEREVIFEDYIDEVWARERETQRKEKKETVERLKMKLLSPGEFNSEITWAEASERMRFDEDWNALQPYDRLW